MKSTTKKPASKKKTPSKPVAKKPAPKAAQFGFPMMGGMPGMGGGKKKKGTTTTFATAMDAMNNLMDDLELVDTPGAQEFLASKEKKESLLNWIAKNDYEKFEMILGMFNSDEENKTDVEDLARQVRNSMNESLLHLAVVYYVTNKDDRYMKKLISIGFPFYEEDENGDIPVFALSLWDSDESFIHGLDLLVKGGFDVNYTNSSGKDLLEFLSEFNISSDKVKFMNKCGLKSQKLINAKDNIEGNGELSESQKNEILAIL
jgi:hypothetical protein